MERGENPDFVKNFIVHMPEKLLQEFKCILCRRYGKRSKIFLNAISLEKHMAIHPSCEICGPQLKFKNKTELTNHSNEVHIRKGYSCRKCKQNFPFQFSLENHNAFHCEAKNGEPKNPKEMTEESNITISAQDINDQSSLPNPDQTKMIEATQSIVFYECKFCALKLSSQSSYEMHMSDKHSTPPAEAMEMLENLNKICNLQSQNQSENIICDTLNQNINDLKRKAESMVFICKTCQWCYVGKQNFDNHVLEKHNVKSKTWATKRPKAAKDV